LATRTQEEFWMEERPHNSASKKKKETKRNSEQKNTTERRKKKGEDVLTLARWGGLHGKTGLISKVWGKGKKRPFSKLRGIVDAS